MGDLVDVGDGTENTETADATMELNDQSEKTEDEKLIPQSELDRILQKRLKRQEDQLLKKYADYDQLKEAADAYQKIQDEKASDAERWEKRIAAIEAERNSMQSELTKLQRTALVADLAADAGLPKSMWRRVSGETPEEIEEDIADLVNDLGITKGSKEDTPAKRNASKQRREVYGGGGENERPDPDTDAIVAAIPRGPQIRVDKPRVSK